MNGDITVRLWTPEELATIKRGEDPYLATVFLNKSTFSREEMRAYPYELRRRYVAGFGPDMPDLVTFYATDDDCARRYLSEQYTIPPMYLAEVRSSKRQIRNAYLCQRFCGIPTTPRRRRAHRD